MPDNVVERNQRVYLIDTVRGISILAIIAFHIVQRWPFQLSRITYIFSSFGSYGVDVFFALSGFLVGIATSKSFDSCHPSSDFRQLLNRLLRVYLPYLSALLIFVAGISVLRPTAFHLSYLFLVQNYLVNIPFFLISWFLCILFYFYIVAFLLLKIPGNSAVASSLVMLVSALGCFVLRLFVLSSGQLTDAQPFGYYFTATHLRSDSIFLAFAAGLVFQRLLSKFGKLRNKGFTLLSLILFSFMPLLVAHLHSSNVKYLFAPFFAAIFSTLLAAYCYLDTGGIGFLRVPKMLAMLSIPAFSLYLTHSIALEAATIAQKKYLLNQPLMLALLIALIGLFTVCFYFAIEKPSKVLATRLALQLTSS